MKAFKSVFLILLLLFSGTSGYAVTLNFEDLPDSVSVANFYASEGVLFTEAISLTAGFSLNEFDFPPSSGQVSIGDDWGPMEITFDSSVENIFANFTYGTQLTFAAFDINDSLLATFVNPGVENYGLTEIISLGFTGVNRLVIAGDPFGASYIMDDFNFDFVQDSSPSAVPEPTTFLLMTCGIIGLTVIKSRKD